MLIEFGIVKWYEHHLGRSHYSCPQFFGATLPSAAAAAAASDDDDDDAIAFYSLISPGAHYSPEHSSAYG